MAIKFLNTVQVDTDVLYVDASTNKVGIGTTSPSTVLEVSSTGVNGVDISQSASNASQSGRLFFTTNTASEGFALFNANGTFQINSGGIPNDTSGTNRISIIGSSGNVGIGTTSPSTKLHVSGGDIRIDDTERIEFGAGGVRINNDAAGRMYYRAPLGFYWETNGGYRMVLNSSGNVGIGTTSPGEKLQVDGVIDANGSDGYKINGKGWAFESSNNLQLGDWDGQGFSTSIYGSNSSEVMRVTGNNVGIGTTAPSEKLVVRNGTASTDVKILAYNSAAGTEATLRFSTIASETDYEKAAIIARNAAGSFGRSDMHFALDSVADSGNVQFSDTKMTILNGGNVGIGTTSPSYKLDISGEGRFTGDLRCLSLIQTSQRDQKENINDIDKSKAKAIPFKEYTYKSSIDGSSRKRYGVVVEDIEDDYPELVHTDADGVKGVNYIDLLVKRVAELEKELEDISLTPGANGADGTNGTNGLPGAKGATGSAGSNGKDGNSHLSNITSIGINGKSGQLEIVIGTSTYKFNPDK